MEPSPKKVLKKDERGREGNWDFCGGVNGERIRLIEELVEREDRHKQRLNRLASRQQFKDNETAEDIKKIAMKRLKETKKRNSDEGGASPKHRVKACRATSRLFARESSS